MAQIVYNDSRVNGYFDLRIWICVSDPFDEAEIARGIIESVQGSCPNTSQLNVLYKHLIDSISGKKFLLVLDDVWTEDYSKWESLKNTFKCGGSGSRILVTTRNERVAKMVGTMDGDIHRLGQLSDEDCWLLLRCIALFGRSEDECRILEGIGREIANNCKGLPLAAKVLGSLLRFKNNPEEWENVLNSEIWEMKEAQVDLFSHLLLSYNELSPTQKRCFSYCAVFPKDFEMTVVSLIGQWIAQGYLGSHVGSTRDMELKGRECFDILAMRSLFQDFEKDEEDGQIQRFKMHDIIHDFAQFLRKNGRMEATTRAKMASCRVCNPPLALGVKEYRSLFCDKEPPKFLCGCPKSLRVLEMKCKLQSIPQGVRNLIHLRWLDLSENRLSKQDTKMICKLNNLQFLWLSFCDLREIPTEIGNLIHMRHLDLRGNKYLEELPESMCGLLELRSLNIDYCDRLTGLPEGIQRLINLKHLHNMYTVSLWQLPQGLAQLAGLRTLREFCGQSNLRLLKNLNRLTGSLKLRIRLQDGDDAVEDAREAELKEKMHIRNLRIGFPERDDGKACRLSMDVMEALQPHPNLQNLEISRYSGSRLPGWIASPSNQLRYIKLFGLNHLSSLPPLGKLPCLEELEMDEMCGLEFVGPEFMDWTSISDAGLFSKLKILTFSNCPKWKEWEDITADSAAVAVMPRLTMLAVKRCESLAALPRRLLHKASSLEKLDISGSLQLRQHLQVMNGSIQLIIGYGSLEIAP